MRRRGEEEEEEEQSLNELHICVWGTRKSISSCRKRETFPKL
jgi:hypothetical protein